ncbi:MAG TPA: F0F1 ATP synthase subunit B [Steroidobacteraceae bacterium]|nr:F0F1 ATP synthase subunit B [Steroidobacteraceae bacterium]
MNINITLVVQALAFLSVAWLVMKFGWPAILGAIEQRQQKIAEGLAAAERGQRDLAEAKNVAGDIIKEAREKATKIIDQANRRQNEMIDEAKGAAQAEGQRLIGDARQEVALESSRVREQLRREVGTLAVAGASQLLGREIDAKAHADLLEKLALDIERG